MSLVISGIVSGVSMALTLVFLLTLSEFFAKMFLVKRSSRDCDPRISLRRFN